MHFNQPSLLIAMPHLKDPNFRKSVVLLLDHQKGGAFGTIINKPSPAKLSDLIKIEGLQIPNDLPVWFGGPVGTSYGLILNNHPGKEDETIAPGVSVTADEKQLFKFIENIEVKDPSPSSVQTRHKCLYPFRFIVGYAGWTEGQLDREMKDGAWIQTPLNNDLLFNIHFQDMWQVAFNNIGINPNHLAPAAQPYLN